MALTKEREYGAEQPSIGKKLMFRIPFYHYRFEYQDFIQGVILSCVPLGIVTVMVSILEIPVEVAVLMVVINNFAYLLHTHFGDPSVAGWITAGIPLYISFLVGFAAGPERIQAMIALQILVAVIFLFLGVTGWGAAVIRHFPISMRSGILLGAGVASLARIFDPANVYVTKIPIAFAVAALGSFFMLFSNIAIRFRGRYGWFAWIASFGIAPGFVAGYAVGLATGEIPPPTGIFENIFIAMPFGQMVGSFSAIGVGIPPAGVWVGAISLAIVAYVLAFGDIIVLQALIIEADSARKDEKIVYRASRNHIITAIRNFAEGIFMPYLPLAGPQWTGGQALVINRYRYSTPKQEPSYWGGATGLFWGMSIAMLFFPIVALILPAKEIGFGLTLLIQGWLCCYIALAMCKNNIQRGIAGVMASALIFANYVEIWHSAIWSGPTMALIVGAILYFALEHGKAKEEVKEGDKKS